MCNYQLINCLAKPIGLSFPSVCVYLFILLRLLCHFCCLWGIHHLIHSNKIFNLCSTCETFHQPFKGEQKLQWLSFSGQSNCPIISSSQMQYTIMLTWSLEQIWYTGTRLTLMCPLIVWRNTVSILCSLIQGVYQKNMQTNNEET